jgi:peroxiredoxin
MAATLYLFACALATAQAAPAEAPDWQLAPRLGRGQELVYRGTFTEEARNQGVQFNRTFRLEARAFVLDTQPQGAEVAFFTVWKGRPLQANATAELETNSARMELAKVDPQGRVVGRNAAALTVPNDGPPVIESGAFVEVPRGRLRPDQAWEVLDEGRPARTWQVMGVEMLAGTRCIKLYGTQQSDDWDKPHADRTAWRRQDTVWVAPRSGFAYKVERVIECREPARKEATQKSILRYELESALQYPGQLFEDRQREIRQAQAFAEAVGTLMPRAGQAGPRPFEAILKRIEYHYDHQPPTPYRDAIRHVQRLAEAGKRGEVPPETPNDSIVAQAQVIAIGKRAPDFLALDLVSKESVSLHRWAGKPVVLLFYSPAAASAEEVLRFGQQLGDAHGDQVGILGMAVSENREQIMKQREEIGVKFPILSGTGLRLTYRVDATPKFVILDSAGVMRGSYDGWGPEIPQNVHEDLIRCLTAPR